MTVTPLVSICCLTYNHAPFIKDCLDGFLAQKTSFPIEILIHDDASTDGTDVIIKEYAERNPNVIFPLFEKENQYSKGFRGSMDIEFNYSRARGKYIAYCEGDDYWTDPQKLQKQVDFLESHPEYVICSHDFLEYVEQQKQFKDKSRQEDFLHKELKQGASYYDYSLGKYFDHWFTQPLTCLFRNGDYLQAIPIDRYNYYRDYILYYYILKEGKGALLQDVMGVYRVNNDGIWSSMSGIEQLKIVICDAYNIYSVEGDGRALNKMDNCEKEVVYRYYLSKDYRHILKELREYRKMVPLKHFFSFVLSVLKKIHHN